MAGPDDERTSKDRLEHLLAECLELVETEGASAVERLIRENPEQADDLRRCLGILDELALVDESEDGELPPPGPIGDFRPLKRIGMGGMGEVWLAEQTSLRRLVALKLIRPMVASPVATERFRREAVAVARLKHPNIVEIYASGEHDGQLYIAMEFVPGKGLDELYRERASNPKAYSMAELLGWARDLATALAAAHGENLVHRDVKPSNVRITPEGRAVLLDFGLARHLDADTLSMSGAFVGSAAYAAPEQVTARRGAIGPRTDIYALGATIYEGATGRTPFKADSAEELFHQILHQAPPSARSISSEIHREVDTVLAHALAKVPEHRYADAATLADDFAALRERRPVSVRPISTFTRFVRWSRREPLKASLLAMAVVVLGLGWFFVDRTLEGRAADRARQIEDGLEAGYRAHGRGKSEDAIEHFEGVLELDPANVEAIGGIGLALNRWAKPTEALKHLEKHEELVDGSVGLQAIRGAASRLESGQGSNPDAPTMEPRTPLDHFLLCNIEYGRDTPEADRRGLRHARQAVFKSPRPRRIYFHVLIRAARVCGDQEIAEDALATLTSLWPDDPETWYNAGRVWEEADPARAKAEFERYLAARPDSAMGWFYLANVRYALGDPDGALEGYDRATSLMPSFVAFAGNAAHILNQRGDVRGALARYLIIVEHAPSEQVMTIALQLANKVGDWKAVKDLAARLVAMNDESYRGHFLLGLSLLNNGDPEGAGRHFERAQAIEPASAEVAAGLEALDAMEEQGKQLERIRAGAEPAGTALELCAIAHVASLQDDLPLAADLYMRAFTKDENVLQGMADPLFRAGVALARAGTTDDPPAAAPEWRERARLCLNDALDALDEQLGQSPERLGTLLRLDWLENPRLAGVRPPAPKLRAEERKAWQQLWQDVETMVAPN